VSRALPPRKFVGVWGKPPCYKLAVEKKKEDAKRPARGCKVKNEGKEKTPPLQVEGGGVGAGPCPNGAWEGTFDAHNSKGNKGSVDNWGVKEKPVKRGGGGVSPGMLPVKKKIEGKAMPRNTK